MATVNLKKLATELNLSVSTVSKALMNSHEISAETKERVLLLAKQLNYVPNPYASSLRRKTSKTIAVVIPEVADSFFSIAINGIEAVAQDKGYHVLIYLTHESFQKEKAILNDFQSGRVDGVLMSVTSETEDMTPMRDLHSRGIPVIFFDRVCEEIETGKITTDDFESGYNAAKHLIEGGCLRIAFLSFSKSLSISNKRMEGYRKALADHNIGFNEEDLIFCTNDDTYNHNLLKNILVQPRHPDGIIASVEKLTTTVYLVCRELGRNIPRDVQVISFSNLQSALILNPALSTITQPAFDMGKTAASILFRALEKPGFNLKKENHIIPSVLIPRDSTIHKS
ncbi:MAG: LacI family DNA-binding transcriptional regulator [Bacteroidetes bacterium]|nr:LacI family DNA-binding transcriptional regulator [Bacteroidota bacterium]